MQLAKKKVLILCSVLAAIFVVGAFFTLYYTVIKPAYAFSSNHTTYKQVGELLRDSTTATGDNPFSTNVRTLINMIYGSDGDASEQITSLISTVASTPITAKDLREKTYNKTADQSIVVRLGGLDWIVTYISTDDTSNNLIATLWLSNNHQDAWSGRNENLGKYHGFCDGGLYSDWSADWWSDSTSSYPSNMYGTSYIRVEALNNPNNRKYATNSSTLIDGTAQSTSHPFALYTMSTFGLTNYITTPDKMPWMKTFQSTKTMFNWYYDCNNGSLYNETGTGSWYNANYAGKTGYTNWGGDYLWLPSLTETGYKDDTNNYQFTGLWETNTAERTTRDGSTTTEFASSTLGTAQSSYTDKAYVYSRTRTVTYDSPGGNYGLIPNGTDYINSPIGTSRGVRPALLLNLGSAVSHSVILCDITFDKQGGSGGTDSLSSVIEGNTLPNVTAPTKTGYTFGGYYTAVNGGGTKIYNVDGTSAISASIFTGDTTLYAKWTANTYKVTLDNQGAITAGSTSVSATYNAAMPSITIPAKTGYNFGGYYTAVNGGGTQYYTASGASAKNYTLTTALTLYAKWTAASYTLTYNPNGGSVTPTNKSVTYNSAYGALATPTRTGSVFDNWYTRNTLKSTLNDRDVSKRIELADNAIWAFTNAGDLNRYFHLVITFKGEFGRVQFNDFDMTSDLYYVSTDNAGLSTIVIDYKLISDHISKRGDYNYDKDYRFVDFESAANMTDITIIECWLGDLVTADTIVTTAGNHTIYARWLANNYNVVMDESGFAGLLSPVVGGYENSGWADGEYDTKHVRSGNYSYKITATTASREFYAYTSEAYTINASNKSHIFYIQFWGYQEALIPNSSCQVYWPVEEPCFGPVKYLPLRAANQWNMYSFYGDRSQNALTASTKFRIDFNNLSKAGELWLDDFMIYDLTAIFGAGNEPSKEWCDLMIMTGVAIQELHYDRAENLTAHRSTMVKTGQTFAGWTTTPRTTMTVNKVQYADQAKVSNLTSTKGANVVMYAVWTPRAQKITTDANFVEAVGVLRGAGDYYYGDKVTLRAYAKGNFVFVGWLKNGAEFDGNTAHDVVFYAVSDDKYTAVFKKASSKTDDVYVQIACQDESVESGFGYASYMMTIKSGVAYAHLTAVAADGFKFVGWMISGAMSTSYKTDVVDIPLAEVRGKIVCAVFAKA